MTYKEAKQLTPGQTLYYITNTDGRTMWKWTLKQEEIEQIDRFNIKNWYTSSFEARVMAKLHL